MSLKRTFTKNTFINLCAYGYLLIASLISIPIMLNSLGVETFGQYMLLAAAIPLTSILDIGLTRAVIRLTTLHSGSKRLKILQTSLFLYFTIAIIVGFGSFLVFSQLTTYSFLLTTCLSIIITINLINNHFLTLPQANQHFGIYNLKSWIVGTSNTLLSAWIVSQVPTLTAIFLVQLIAHLLLSLSLSLYHTREMDPRSRHVRQLANAESRMTSIGVSVLNPKLNKSIARELLTFGLKQFLGTASVQVNAQLPKFILGSMVSAQAVTVFTIPHGLIAKANGVVSQATIALFPLSTLLTKPDRLPKLKAVTAKAQWALVIVGLMAIASAFLFGELFLRMWLKNPTVVAQSYPILVLLSVYFFFSLLSQIPTTIFHSLNKPEIPSIFAILSLLLDGVGMLLLVPIYGTIGAAYAIVGRVIILIPVYLLVFWQVMKKA
jgi:O-antigen/teichoic acid export membrane protein